MSKLIKGLRLNPADYVTHVFGGVRATARALGKSPGTVSWWVSRGTIPTSVRQLILETAKKQKLPITSEDLDYGRKIQG